jgi:hypothetical protein
MLETDNTTRDISHTDLTPRSVYAGFITVPFILATTVAALLSTAPGLGYDFSWLQGIAVTFTIGYVVTQGFLYREAKLSIWRGLLCGVAIQLYNARESTFISVAVLFISMMVLFGIGVFIRWIISRKKKHLFIHSLASRWRFAIPCALAIAMFIVAGFNENAGHVRSDNPLRDIQANLWLANDMARVETLVVYWVISCIVLSIVGFILRGRSKQ